MPKRLEDNWARYVFLKTVIIGILIMFTPILFPYDTKTLKKVRCYWTGQVFSDYWNVSSYRFDHPEPNYAIFGHVAEAWSCLTTIPFSGVLLLYNAIRQDFDVVLVFLFFHIFVMYCGAFFSHMTLIAPLFTLTVSAVIANSLHAFFWWGTLLGGHFKLRNISWAGTILGLIVGIWAILYIQHIEQLAPIGGFYTLVIVQPPFVFLALCSTMYLYRIHPNDQGYKYLFCGACLLMFSMGISAIETFITPMLFGNFPVLHVLIHLMEQLGIYMYGTGTAWVHYKYINKCEKLSIAYDSIIPYVKLGSPGMHMPPKAIYDDVHFDLLDKESRVNPKKINEELFAMRQYWPCPVFNEKNCWAISNPSEIKNILNDNDLCASNPYPDNRLIGLSTTDGYSHTVQRKLVSRFFSKSHLQRNQAAYSDIAKIITQKFVSNKGGDLVTEWGYRIAMASGLHAIGMPLHDILNEEYLDRLVMWSNAMVKLVSPVGGMGLRGSISFSQFCGFCKNIFRSIPATIGFVCRVGLSCAWDILRPDLNFKNNWHAPRSGVFTNNDSIPEVPKYMQHIHDIWTKYATSEPDSLLATLYQAHQQNIISKADAILLIVQCLVSMTTANALVNSLLGILTLDECKQRQIGQSVSTITSYINEHLCQIPPLQRLPRRMRENVTLSHSGLVCPAGSQLILMLGAANGSMNSSTKKIGSRSRSRSRSRYHKSSNEEAYSEGTTSVTNESSKTSLTFGWGVHKCLGENLVKLEMQLALQSWIKLAPNINSLTPGEHIWQVDVGNYGYTEYKVCLD